MDDMNVEEGSIDLLDGQQIMHWLRYRKKAVFLFDQLKMAMDEGTRGMDCLFESIGCLFSNASAFVVALEYSQTWQPSLHGRA